jgi:hypothetical protein
MVNTKILVGTAVVLAWGSGAFAGYILCERKTVKRLEEEYEARYILEEAQLKKFYKHKDQQKKTESPVSRARKIHTEEAEEIVEKEGYASKPKITIAGPEEPDVEDMGTVEVVSNVFVEVDEDFVWDEEVEQANREMGKPYVVTQQDYFTSDDYEQVTWTYYAGDGQLANDKEEPVDDYEMTVGRANLERFGHGSRDRNVVYIRNERLNLDIEVIRSTGKYGVEVCGFLEHADVNPRIRHAKAHEKRRNRRIGDDDEY